MELTDIEKDEGIIYETVISRNKNKSNGIKE
jgi:hypothetical protein